MKCPICAEEIQDDAKKCRYCSEWLVKPGEHAVPPPAGDVAIGGGRPADPDLTPFLLSCPAADLLPLISYLELDESSELPFNAKEFSDNEDQKRHQEFVGHLISEIQRHGGHGIANLVRGRGVSYVQIVRDACDALRLPYRDGESLDALEARVFAKVTGERIQPVPADEREDLLFRCSLPELKRGGRLASLTGWCLTGFLIAASLPAALLAGAGTVAVVGARPSYELTIPIICFIASLRESSGRTGGSA